MRIIFSTENGSTYEIDDTKRSWSRLVSTENSGMIRTMSGPMTHFEIPVIGRSGVIFGPPLAKGFDFRRITTSLITAVEYHPDEEETSKEV